MSNPPARSSQRQDRLAKALRANLKRRKAQNRERGQEKARAEAQPQTAGEETCAQEDAASAGPAPHPRPNMAQKQD